MSVSKTCCTWHENEISFQTGIMHLQIYLLCDLCSDHLGANSRLTAFRQNLAEPDILYYTQICLDQIQLGNTYFHAGCNRKGQVQHACRNNL